MGARSPINISYHDIWFHRWPSSVPRFQRPLISVERCSLQKTDQGNDEISRFTSSSLSFFSFFLAFSILSHPFLSFFFLVFSTQRWRMQCPLTLIVPLTYSLIWVRASELTRQTRRKIVLHGPSVNALRRRHLEGFYPLPGSVIHLCHNFSTSLPLERSSPTRL